MRLERRYDIGGSPWKLLLLIGSSFRGSRPAQNALSQLATISLVSVTAIHTTEFMRGMGRLFTMGAFIVARNGAQLNIFLCTALQQEKD